MPVKKLTFEVSFIVEKDEDEYHAFCPSLKGLHTCGRTEKEALENAECAVEVYLESLLNHNEPIPLSCVHEEALEPISATRPSFSLIEIPIELPA
jgi:predicted RNase H-like HicB family nuclease